MKKQNKKEKWDWSIEIPGYLFLISIFLAIWVNEYRWKLFFTGIFFMIIAILNCAVKIKKKKENKNENTPTR